MSDEYNGYTNRETWAAHMHLSNDEWLYNLATETVAQAAGGGPFAAANRLQEVVDDLVQVNRASAPGRANERLTLMDREVGSWWRVDWRDVAKAFAEQ